MGIIGSIVSVMVTIFWFVVGIVVALLILLFIIDRTQTKNAVLRNYPVIGRLRSVFEHLGVFFRQYFFAMDREEMPFNREIRNYVYSASKVGGNTIPFGSTRDLRVPGSVMFANAAFPELGDHDDQEDTLVIGEGIDHPFSPGSFFNISAMSYGSLSKVAVEALSRGAKKAGCWLNTGEGGLSPYHLEGGCDIVFQIGTAKYGVRDADGNLDVERLKSVASKPQVKMFEIKLSQGAKPGKGGLLPAEKVDAEVAEIRGIEEGVACYSPNRHPDIGSIKELLAFIANIKQITQKPCGFKMVIGDYDFLDELFSAIKKQPNAKRPDFFTVDSADGGTGAAPRPLFDYVGMPLKESLQQVVAARDRAGLTSRVRIIASGKLVNPGEIAWALAAGADFINSARGFMLSLGCIQAMHCHKNNCPTGITTHNHRLQRGLVPTEKADRIAQYHGAVVHDVTMVAVSCGHNHARELNPSNVRISQKDGISQPMPNAV